MDRSEVEVGRLEEEAKRLKETVLELAHRAGQVHRSGSQHVRHLQELDEMQGRIQECARVLESAVEVQRALQNADESFVHMEPQEVRLLPLPLGDFSAV